MTSLAPLALLELTKPRLVALVLFSAAAGYFLAPAPRAPLSQAALALLGTALVAAGSMALNEWMERTEDALMRRTQWRPLPAGKLSPRSAAIFGVTISIAGLALLVSLNTTAAFLSFLTWLGYLAFYTPMKRATTFCTLVGALPGALPPLIGWSVAAGTLSFKAWILFAIIFMWQMPHFLSIAWLCREDYRAADFKMLSVEDGDGRRVASQIVLYSILLLPFSLMPFFAGMTGYFYFFSALILSGGQIVLAMAAQNQMDRLARPLFRASILYLTLIMTVMLVDKT